MVRRPTRRPRPRERLAPTQIGDRLQPFFCCILHPMPPPEGAAVLLEFPLRSDMQLPARDKVIVSGIIFALVFCLTVRPVLNAADPDSTSLRNRDSLAENLFRYASDLSARLHGRPLEERSASDYHRALDAYGQVIRLNTDNYFSAESLAR